MEIIDLAVTSVGGLGDGIATHRGKPVFVAKACAGDRLRVQLVHENHDGYTGVIESVLEASSQRRVAPCEYFDRCGGCSLQQWQPEHYEQFKTRMVQQAIRQAGYDAFPASVKFLPAASRRRVEFKVGHANGAFQLGFHAPRSHTVVPVERCLVLTPALQLFIPLLKAALSSQPFASALYAVGVAQADSGIDLTLIFREAIPPLPDVTLLAQELDVSRISVARKDEKACALVTLKPVTMTLGGHAVELPPSSFLQAAGEGQEALTQLVMRGTAGAGAVLDLFCGIGTYSFPLSAHADVHAVEMDDAMVSGLQRSAKKHAVKRLTAEVRDLFKRPLSVQELSRFDAAVINPPRAGAKAQTEQLAQSGIGTAVMVSCNPATFARDAKLLKAAGFRLEHAEGIDQFVWSPHLEIGAVFKR